MCEKILDPLRRNADLLSAKFAEYCQILQAQIDLKDKGSGEQSSEQALYQFAEALESQQNG